jgi:hypothetical protein
LFRFCFASLSVATRPALSQIAIAPLGDHRCQTWDWLRRTVSRAIPHAASSSASVFLSVLDTHGRADRTTVCGNVTHPHRRAHAQPRCRQPRVLWSAPADVHQCTPNRRMDAFPDRFWLGTVRCAEAMRAGWARRTSVSGILSFAVSFRPSGSLDPYHTTSLSDERSRPVANRIWTIRSSNFSVLEAGRPPRRSPNSPTVSNSTAACHLRGPRVAPSGVRSPG